ncbi:hypothetical protein EDB85DRAFT_1957085 [Lactarius pseudohatsudake]|nr:hypothetical protein EDB85DRAFT_1957085 [Lactarius pseudohatsudake]
MLPLSSLPTSLGCTVQSGRSGVAIPFVVVVVVVRAAEDCAGAQSWHWCEVPSAAARVVVIIRGAHGRVGSPISVATMVTECARGRSRWRAKSYSATT